MTLPRTYGMDSVNAHAEELRQYFVSHEGQRTLEIEANGKGTPGWPLDCADMARQFAQKIHENVRGYPDLYLSSMVCLSHCRLSTGGRLNVGRVGLA